MIQHCSTAVALLKLDSHQRLRSKQGVVMRVCVLGAGIVGLASAYALSGAGHEVTVIDRARPGSGASGGRSGLANLNSAISGNSGQVNCPGFRGGPLG